MVMDQPRHYGAVPGIGDAATRGKRP